MPMAWIAVIAVCSSTAVASMFTNFPLALGIPTSTPITPTTWLVEPPGPLDLQKLLHTTSHTHKQQAGHTRATCQALPRITPAPARHILWRSRNLAAPWSAFLLARRCRYWPMGHPSLLLGTIRSGKHPPQIHGHVRS